MPGPVLGSRDREMDKACKASAFVEPAIHKEESNKQGSVRETISMWCQRRRMTFNTCNFWEHRGGVIRVCFLLLKCKSSCRQCVSQWVWLGSNKTLFIKTGWGPDLVLQPELAISQITLPFLKSASVEDSFTYNYLLFSWCDSFSFIFCIIFYT